MSSTIAPGSSVLVTGANGYIASHVVDQLLEAGFNVRGTVRDVKEAAGLLKKWEDKHGKDRVDLIVVKDIAAPGALDLAVQGLNSLSTRRRIEMLTKNLNVSGIAHIASNVSFDPNPNTVVTEVVSSLHSLLESAAKTAEPWRPPTTGVARKISEETYSEDFVREAWAPPPYTQERAMAVYGASKIAAERALFAYAKEKKPHFTTNSIVLGVNFGKVLDWSVSASSGDFIKELFKGNYEKPKQLTYHRAAKQT
ncbi:NAD(P)-binding protein [Colletotrichum tofieldiae]|nr:NAD(P)-binding protein [Colletotrichum tofieldiae]